MKKIILAMIMMLGVVACSSLNINGNNSVSGDSTNKVLKHEVEVINAGTKSEGRIGKLKIGSYELPAIFMYVTDSEKTYKFNSNIHLWGDHEYFPVAEKIKEVSVPKVITEAQLNTGYYLGSTKLKNTPSNWIFVKWSSEGAAYINIEKVEEIIKLKPFSDLKLLDTPLGIELK